MASNQDELISEICGITGTTPSAARQILEAADWNTEEAVRLYYASQDGEDLNETEMDEEPAPRRAGETGASQGGQSSRSSRPPGNPSRMRTLKDLQSGSAGDDSEDEDENKQDFFAGGEKSGLAVQNPNNSNKPADHFKSIMNQARANRPRPGGDDQATGSANFTGRAQTLGGDDVESRIIDDPSSSARPSGSARVTRTLHLWQDGFSVDDGPLYRFDDPANAPTLALINSGRAPLALLGVEPGQEVDLQLNPHKDEKYVQPKTSYKPFAGSGQRLGSPTPGPTGGSAQSGARAPQSAAPAAAQSSAAPSVSIDESQPTIQLQIRLGDGTQLRSRFNTSHTIGDVYDFVNASSTASRARGYALMTTFPSKELSDKSVKLGDLSEYKRGGVVVQKWT
ncbi:hypothetical protein CAC42_235 [Sphaceloma murrayae]|uniref:UBX domain-containing protein 1 n=1 Tax=Sphaceloma murrayae TaxID=2082308 RepID=A0A2K1QNB9_9PEZI|nr:hypothetical protein CAC42_235 [Sphaceloma murrayae]